MLKINKLITGLFLISFFVCTEMLFADEYVAYTQPTDDFWQVWMCNITTETHTQLTDSPFDKKTPVWSPDGSQILYRSSNGELYIFSLDKKTERKILETIQYCADPDWISEDEVLFTRFRTDVIDDSDIWLVNLKTGKTKVLVSAPGLQYQPTFSPDKENLIYVNALDNQNHQLFIKNLLKNKEKRLTRAVPYNFKPSYSPDGTKIVFVSDRAGNNDLYMMNMKNSSIKQLTTNQNIDTDPCWIDNEKIVYSSFQDNKFQINIFDLKTMQVKPVIIKNTDCTNPDWKRE
ncbi:TolB family protein [Chlamydiota bacterium]